MKNIKNVIIVLCLLCFITIQTEAQHVMGDTLTIVQKPLMNIPAIVIPGDTLKIYCETESINSNWKVQLKFKTLVIEPDIIDYKKNTESGWWELNVEIPDPVFFELYDLQLITDEQEKDLVKNSVRIIPAERESFCFVHITDAHLPTHIFYPDPASATDSSEMNNLYSVIKDINLINPEFVLFTGDLINEGELEDLENRRVYSRAQRILENFGIPVYLIAGNHDIGGWKSTPEPDGAARRNWWRFFGWPKLDHPPAGCPERTQNYSFNYGNVHFTALEAYDNYDEWKTQYYGSKSFTPMQLEWLEKDLQSAGNRKKVLFFHYDFQEQLNLNDLQVDMALWGHTHKSSGDISAKPYDLSCGPVCDENKNYRVIYFENGELRPQPVANTGANDTSLDIHFQPDNNGQSDSLIARIHNHQAFDIKHGLIRFVMPRYEKQIYLVNAKLLQVDTFSPLPVYYVEFSLDAYSDMDVIISYDSIVIKEDSIITLICEHFNDCPAPAFKKISESGSNDWICHDISGNKVMKVNAYQSDVFCDDWLIFPAVNLNGTLDEVLSFYNYTMYYDTFYPPLKLKYSTDYNGIGSPYSFNWKEILFDTSPENSGEWTYSGAIDISEIQGDKVCFALHYMSSGTDAGTSALWYVDDIKITGRKEAHLYNKETKRRRFEIYPNPVQDRLTIVCPDRDEHRVVVYNLLGICVLEKIVTGTSTLDLQNTSPGIYCILLDDQMEKLVKD